MELDKQGSKPTGSIGIFIGKLMNIFHTGFYKKHYKNALPNGPLKIVDIGCGGGKFINFLARTNKSYIIYGIDHSSEMIELSRVVNKEEIKNGQVEVAEGSVLELPFENESVDLITAHETIQFWPDIEKAFAEIYRALKKGGTFSVINRYPPEGTKWWKMAKLKNEHEYKIAFEKAGFDKIDIDLGSKNGWIINKSTK